MVASPVTRCPPRASSCVYPGTMTQRPPSALLFCSPRASRSPPAAAPFEKSRATAAPLRAAALRRRPSHHSFWPLLLVLARLAVAAGLS
eukprot:906865-Prymnesium_polylepis.1